MPTHTDIRNELEERVKQLRTLLERRTKAGVREPILASIRLQLQEAERHVREHDEGLHR